ncbi:hypothetical protein HXY33_03510 [Candidatus Bathyarchaeota archaeon]|nr:hypothetical protein [Candidatus Bathyarchaeota archaeon]
MKLKNKIQIAFFAFSIISFLAITPLISNYLEFYRAIEKCEVNLHEASLNLTRLNNGLVYLTLIFNVTNPTGFRGLTISTTTCNIRYITPDQTDFKQLQGRTETFHEPLDIPPLETTKMILNFTFSYLSEQLSVQEFMAVFLMEPEYVRFLFTGQFVLNAYTYTFAISMGPFASVINFG